MTEWEGLGIGIVMCAVGGGMNVDRINRIFRIKGWSWVRGLGKGLIGLIGLIGEALLVTVGGMGRGGIWLGMVSGPTQRSPTVGF